MTVRLSRRRLIGSLGVLALSAPFWRNDGWRTIAKSITTVGAGGWRAVLPTTDGAHAIGALYLSQTPEEADPESIMRALDLALGVQSARLGPVALRAHLQEQIRRDFEQAETVQIDGWILARTESRLCALSTLV